MTFGFASFNASKSKSSNFIPIATIDDPFGKPEPLSFQKISTDESFGRINAKILASCTIFVVVVVIGGLDSSSCLLAMIDILD